MIVRQHLHIIIVAKYGFDDFHLAVIWSASLTMLLLAASSLVRAKWSEKAKRNGIWTGLCFYRTEYVF